jgi:hypothetical protein
VAEDLASLRQKLLDGAASKFSSGIKSYTVGGRTVTYSSPAELVDAILKLEGAQRSTSMAVCIPEMEDSR